MIPDSGELGERRRFLAILLCVVLLPSLSSLAVRERGSGPRVDEDGVPVEHAAGTVADRPRLHPRPSSHAPLDGVERRIEPGTINEPGVLLTSTGTFRVGDSENQRDLPGDLRAEPNATAHGAGIRSGGLNYALLSTSGRLRAGAIESAIAGAGGRIAGLVRGGYVLWIPPAGMQEFLYSEDFAAFSPVPPAHKIFPDIGRRPLIEKRRAHDPVLRLRVEVVAGVQAPAVVERRLAAHGDAVRPLGEHYGRDTYLVEADAAQVRQIARLPWVVSIHEEHELLLQNYEVVPMLQVGSWEDRGFERPFWAAGLDGTGQIVGVADDGLSLDSPMFSDTATDPGSPAAINAGTPHRKLVLYEMRSDFSSCDSPLSGGGTHGNVVAGMIAGNAAEAFGYFATFQPNRPEILTGLNLDGLAKGAMIAFQDIGVASQCRFNELVEVGGNVTVPGNDMIDLMTATYERGARLQILPFAIPNFDSTQFANCESLDPCGDPAEAGIYTTESEQVDRFLANHLESMAFLPAGNNGGLYPRQLGRIVDLVPDAADGDLCNDGVDSSWPGYEHCTGFSPFALPVPVMIQAPATAKNDVTVGSSRVDCGTEFGDFNCEEAVSNFTAKGPESVRARRAGPTIVAPGHDDSDVFGAPNSWAVAVLGSADNDQLAPVQGPDAGRPLVLDDGNAGSSFAAAAATAQGAIVRQYFEDGFYPTGAAVASHGAGVSGALVKAMLLLMTDYVDHTITGSARGANGDDVAVASNRCGTWIDSNETGATLGVIGNYEQGCGRPVLAWGLPLANYPDTAMRPILGPGTPEGPAPGLFVADFVGTGEAPISVSDLPGGRTFDLQVIPPWEAGMPAALRCALVWIDPPSTSGMDSEGFLINDLDLVLTDPDGVPYRGNRYDGPWSVPDPGPGADRFNPHESIHVAAPSPGAWTLTVTATSGPIGNSGPTEDANGNFRLDPGEDADADGLLDLGGQPFAVACAGPILTPAQVTPSGGHPGTGNRLTWDRSRYGCRQEARLRLFDPTLPPPSAVEISERAVIEVHDSDGAVVEVEQVAFDGGEGAYSAHPVPMRRGIVPVPGNGVLEVDDGFTILAVYPDADAPVGTAGAAIDCRPDLLASQFGLAGESDRQAVVSGGCDGDSYLDAGEVVQ